jgi:NAD(P)-dependent dehydrogenase (short-subunit alcohol dehydrogenase family)
MAKKLLDHRMSEPISPLIDVVVNALAAIFIILMIYMVVVQPRKSEAIPPFKLAEAKFESGDFLSYPVVGLSDKQETSKRLDRMAQQYNQIAREYPYIFVVGHANEKDDPTAPDKTDAARWERNWNFAGRRASLIAKELQKRFTEQQAGRIVVVSSGEFDKRDPIHPLSQENAWVEVIFGREWKPPSYQK